jgi:hypothetical protein
MIDFYPLDAQEAAWTLVAPCEGEHSRLLLTGTARLPVDRKEHALRCTFVDAPNPVSIDGTRGTLRVRTSSLCLRGEELGLVSVAGTVEAEWTALAPSGGPNQTYTIELSIESRVRL